MTLSSLTRPLFLSLTLSTLTTIASAQSFTLPEEWAGGTSGSKTNNPFVAGGKPLWKAVNIWPDSVTDPNNFKDMQWDGKSWVPVNGAEESFGGQPAIAPGEFSAVIAARSAWSGNPGEKLAALVFIAPKTGNYKIEGNYKALVWNGDPQQAKLTVRKLDRKAMTSEKVGSLPLGPTDVAIENSNVFLEEGQELAFIPTFTAMHTAASVTFSSLKLTWTGEAALPDAKVGSAASE